MSLFHRIICIFIVLCTTSFNLHHYVQIRNCSKIVIILYPEIQLTSMATNNLEQHLLDQSIYLLFPRCSGTVNYWMKKSFYSDV